MVKANSQVSRNAMWAISQTIVSACVLFFLYRFLLTELGAEKLGLWSLILASTSLARIGELGFSNATLRFVGKYVGAGKLDEAAEVVETSLLSISLPFLVLTAVAIPLIGGVLHYVVPETHIHDALLVVPWAMLALWFGVTGGLVQSAIDGCGRMDQRNMVLIATNIVYLTVAMLLTPFFGLKGVAIAQVVQAGVTLVAMWWLLKIRLHTLPLCPWRWSKSRFSEISTFALTMQAGSLAGMLIDPVAKALFSRFGGLEFLAYYDMAYQVINRARSVLVSGFQAIIPQFSITSAPASHRMLFLQSQAKVISMGVPFMTLVMISFPILSLLWIGRTEPTFITTGQILGITWLAVTLLMPAYFFLAGTGRGLPVAAAQVITLIFTAFLGWIGGYVNNQFGPIIGAAIALILGNLYIYIVAIRSILPHAGGRRLPRWIGRRMLESGSICITVIGINLMIAHYAAGFSVRMVTLVVLSIAIVVFAFRNQINPTVDE